MRLVIIYFLAAVALHAGGSEEPAHEPKVMLRMIESIENSKIDELTSKASDGGTTYHMRGFCYLGTVSRDKLTYTIAHAVFVRSRSPGTDTPPARGHDFIIVFDESFRIVAHGRTSFGTYRMAGDILMFGESVVADFASTEPVTRHGGYIEIGLPYPFADRISDEEWDKGTFQKQHDDPRSPTMGNEE